MTVTAISIVPLAAMYEEDRDVVDDYYEYSIIAASEVEAEEMALDQFHADVPIKCLDHFDIEVAFWLP